MTAGIKPDFLFVEEESYY